MKKNYIVNRVGEIVGRLPKRCNGTRIKNFYNKILRKEDSLKKNISVFEVVAVEWFVASLMQHLKHGTIK